MFAVFDFFLSRTCTISRYLLYLAIFLAQPIVFFNLTLQSHLVVSCNGIDR